MSAPNIEMIASLMRSCSLGSRVRRPPPPPSPPPPPPPPPPQNRLLDLTGENEGVTVELNSEVALPYHWEQCLDMRTGEVYYINWKDGTRTTEDPRTFAAETYYTSEDDESSDDDDSSNDCHNAGEDSGDTTSYSSGVSSLSSPSPRETLVAAGCKSCFMYFMVPKLVEDCPKCGGGLLHLGRNGCF